MKETSLLRSHVLFSGMIAATAAAMATQPGFKEPFGMYEVIAFLAPFFVWASWVMGALILFLAKYGRDYSKTAANGVLWSYQFLAVGSGVVIVAIPAWINGAYLSSALVFLLGLIVINCASVCTHVLHTLEPSWWKKPLYWQHTFMHGIGAAFIVAATLYFGNGGMIPTLQSPLIEAIPIIVLAGMFISQFAFAWILERPFASPEAKPAEKRARLSVVQNSRAA